MADRRQTLADASMAAARTHARLKLPSERPIDNYSLVQQLGIWLKTEPLGNLYGFYLRHGQATGIVLNSRHPEDLQRYTCAHELGHHLLGHQSHLDDNGDVNRHDGPLQEQAAQVFAGSFLMPLGLVNRVLRAHDLIGRPLSAVDAYKLSRDMDVSYAACVWRLRTLDLLGQATAQAYVRAGAAAAKQALRRDQPIKDARADVYVVDEVVDHVELAVRVGDEVWVRLPERRSTGYTWTLEESDVPTGPLRWDGDQLLEHVAADGQRTDRPAAVVQTAVDRSRELPPATFGDPAGPLRDVDNVLPRVGAGSVREIGLLAADPGQERIHLQLRRTWTTEPPAASTDVNVHVRPAREIDGHVPQQTAAHAARLSAL